MNDRDEINRRDFLARTAGAAGTAGAFVAANVTPAQAQALTAPPVPVLDDKLPLADFWEKKVFELAQVDLTRAAPELAEGTVRERHQIYCFLLMKLIHRFWNGNKRGPFGLYPWRRDQQEIVDPTRRYHGDMIDNPDTFRVNWDRYVGHNIACIAVDGNGEIIDFDFNHNEFFRSSAEHAESRMVRRLFSLTDIFDSWKTGDPSPGRSRAFSLKDVTLYTSLESCAQCSGVMSLGRVRQVVYLQRDYTTYVIGNIMYNLAGEDREHLPLSPIPIAAADVGLELYKELDDAYRTFHHDLSEAKQANDKSRAFFVSPDGRFVDFEPSITSFLCTDIARNIFGKGGNRLDTMTLKFAEARLPGKPKSLTNKECLAEAQAFYAYADIEGYRGSPHKL
jgi:tRNA(Arg) A34 adenosine deaminase TadA